MDTEESRAGGGELMPATYPPLLAKRQIDCCFLCVCVCACYVHSQSARNQAFKHIHLPIQYVCKVLLCVKLCMFEFFLMII